MQQGLATGAEMILILLTGNRFTLTPGSGNLDMFLLEPRARILLECIQAVVPRRPTSQTLSQPLPPQHLSQRVDTLDLWDLLLSPHRSAQKMSSST